MRPTYSYLLLFILGLVAFGGLLSTPFFYDDRVIVEENQLLRSNEGLSEIWQGHVDDRHLMDGAYRPLLLTFFSAAGRLTDFDPLKLRLITLALHALNAFLLLLFAQKFFGLSKMGAWLISILFLLHPLQTTNIALVWKQSDVWIASASLLSLVFWERFKVLSFFIFILSLGFKESALIIPLLWLAHEMSLPSEGKRGRLLVITAGVTVSFVFYRLLGHLMKMPEVLDGFPAGGSSYFWTQLSIFPLYAKNLFWPTALTIDRSVSVATEITFAHLSVLVFLALAVAFGTYRSWKKSKAATAFLLGMIWLIPTSSFHALSLPYDETRLYLTIGFLSLAAVTWLSPLFQTLPIRTSLAWSLLGTLAISLGFFTIKETHRFYPEERLWASALAVDPTSVRAHYQLGYLARKDLALDEAEAHHRAALALNPDFPNSRLELGIILGQKGDLDGAAEQFSLLLSFPPHWAARGHYHLVLDAIYRNDFSRAKDHLDAVRKVSPNSKMEARGEAILFEKMGKRQEAIAAWKRYLSYAQRSPRERTLAEEAISRLASEKTLR